MIEKKNISGYVFRYLLYYTTNTASLVSFLIYLRHSDIKGQTSTCPVTIVRIALRIPLFELSPPHCALSVSFSEITVLYLYKATRS
jgi:hypothetical protein